MEQVTRKPDRGRSDRADLDALLDEVVHGTLSAVREDGRPWVVPLLFARDGDRILIHGSTGAGALRYVSKGSPVAFCVTSIDGIVVAESTFESSANYRSAVVYGQLENLSGDEQWDALDRLSERMLPGRTSEVRPMTKRETAATIAMALPIVDGEWVMKVRAAGVGDLEEETTAWRGVVPMHVGYGDPVPEPDSVDRPVPTSVLRLIGRSE